LRAAVRTIDALNERCFCASLDRAALGSALDADPGVHGLRAMIEQRCPHLFAAQPVFLSSQDAEAMAQVIGAIEQVVALPAFREAAMGWAPPIARRDPGTLGAFVAYDFHVHADGPRLIEINTNAGGALLNVVLGRAQRACCAPIAPLIGGAVQAEALERRFVDMFLAEWRRAGRAGRPARIAIVDDLPEEQYLYPEFLLFARLFQRFGIAAEVLGPEQLAMRNGELCGVQGRVDLVYNRLTDFALEEPAHAALREAYASGATVVTPHPRAHALYADKRNLRLLSDQRLLRGWGVDASAVETLREGVPGTEVVTQANAEDLWARRRHLFFKPFGGYGSKAAYRGDKLTRRAWLNIVSGGFVAQSLVPPSLRHVGPALPMKLDVRNYVYDGRTQLLAARLYQGQTTNFRTPGGGFAPVFVLPRAVELLAAA
jgi:hypothetical protein